MWHVARHASRSSIGGSIARHASVIAEAVVEGKRKTRDFHRGPFSKPAGI